MPAERIALHLARLQLVPTENHPEGIDVSAPLYDDMLDMLRVYAPDVLEEALPVLEREGVLVAPRDEDRYEVGRWKIPEAVQQLRVEDPGDDVEILHETEHFVVAKKPPVVVCHHSSWTGKRSDPKRRWKENLPMLQRVRDKTGRRVNLVHRLDRGASGCLVLSFAQGGDGEESEEGAEKTPCGVTKALIESMQSPEATKTYIALCDGDGTWNGVNYLEKGWFTFDHPVKDENDKLIEDATTDICFIASAILPPVDGEEGDDSDLEGRKVSIVLARPKSGRWHQIRQHLSSGKIGHAIIGDSSHGRSRTNRIFKKKRHLMKERVCLHLARVQLPATEYSPEGVDVSCPMTPDMMKMLKAMPRELRKDARAALEKEGIRIM